jgi:5-methyltetrahydrofolate--homocysteine methyltransferase
MERTGWKVPLLIGGATTSKAHTSVKIAQHYSQPVVHVLDASRAVGVVTQLVSNDLKASFAVKNREEQDVLRKAYLAQNVTRKLLSLEEARKRKTPIEWRASDIPTPAFTGIRALKNFPLEKIVPFIDWSPFFHAWEIRGRYPALFDDPTTGPKARELFDDAQKLLKRIVDEKLLTANAVYGFFPANAVGDDIELYTDESRTKVLTTLHTLRQQVEKNAGEHNHALADFIAPKETKLPDHIGLFAVTAGLGVQELAAKFEKDHDDYNSIMTKAIGDRLAEAFAECLHKQAREEWGFGAPENLSNEDLIREKYRGIRPAAGYPACPDHTEKFLMWDILKPEENAGIKLTESAAMWPASSVSGVYYAHPEAKYFAVGKIERDQVEDYARRKGESVQWAEKWLAPILNYEP